MDIHSLPPAAMHCNLSPDLLVGLSCYLRRCQAVLIHVKLSCQRWIRRLHKVADTKLLAVAMSYAITCLGCPAVWLPIWIAQTDPVHLLFTA